MPSIQLVKIIVISYSGTPQIFLSLKCSFNYTSSTAQGGGGSFKNRKRIGEILLL